MIKLTSVSLFFLAIGLLTSVSILSGYQVLFVIPMIYFTFTEIKNGRINLPKSTWFLLAFTLTALLSLIVNYDLIPKPSKNFGRLQYFVYGIGGIFVFRVWFKNVSDRTKSILVHAFYLSIVVASAYATWDYIVMPDGRAKGLTETMRYGYGSAMFLLILISASLHHDKIGKWLNIKITIPVILIGFLGMYLTFTRGALLGFLCGLPFALYFYKPKLAKILGSLIFIVILGLGSVYLFGSGKYKTRFLYNKNNSSDVIRRSQWMAAAIATKEKPLLGWGLSNFHTQLKRIKYDYDLDAKNYNDAHAHNLFLEIAAGTGLIGLILFLGWVFSWFYETYKKGGLTRALIIPFGVAFVVSSQFEVTFDVNNASMIFFLYGMSNVE